MCALTTWTRCVLLMPACMHLHTGAPARLTGMGSQESERLSLAMRIVSSPEKTKNIKVRS